MGGGVACNRRIRLIVVEPIGTHAPSRKENRVDVYIACNAATNDRGFFSSSR